MQSTDKNGIFEVKIRLEFNDAFGKLPLTMFMIWKWQQINK